MSGDWNEETDAEALLSIRPETDWLAVIEKKDSGTFAVTVTITRDAATALFASLVRQNDLAVDPAMFAGTDGGFGLASLFTGDGPPIAIDQPNFALLARSLDAQTDSLSLTLLVAANALEAFVQFARATSDKSIDDPGLASVTVTDIVAAPGADPDAFSRLSLPPPPAGPRSDDDDRVIVAIIDEGIGVANDRFRDDLHSTRIVRFLDMDALPSADVDALGAVRDVMTKNRVWTKEVIDREILIAPDEETMYARMGLIDDFSDRRQPHRYRVSHGTHVLDRAAGYDWRDPVERERAMRRPIIAAQLPSQVVADRTDSQMAQTLRDALAWIMDEATNFGSQGKLPLVVNFSFGNYAGPHDGTGEIERTIEQFVTDYRRDGTPCEVVLPAGNSFQSRVHARLTVGPDTPPAELTWRVEPEDFTSSYVQMWLPTAVATGQQIAVELIPPVGAPDRRMSEMGKAIGWTVDGRLLARIYHQNRTDHAGGQRERVTLCIRPSAAWEKGDPVVPAGDWTIRVHAVSLEEDVEVECRIHRDDTLSFESKRGEQSTFVDDGYLSHHPRTGNVVNRVGLDTGPTRRDRTMSIYATSENTVVVGGIMRSDGTPARYSSAGPTSGPRREPDISAPSEDSPAFPGIRASGTYSNSWVRLNGTSVATPAVTRAIADAMEQGIDVQTLFEGLSATAYPGWEDNEEEPATRSRCGMARLGTR